MLFRSSILLLALATIGASNALPYNPTTALVSSNSSAIYLFAPSDDTTTFQLSTINLNSTISTSKTGASVIASSLPLTPQSTTALIVSIDAEDRIYLIAGECSDGASGATQYTLDPSDANPHWTQVPVDTSGIQSPSANGGINVLSGTMQFNDDMYIFGGMCPNSSSLTVDNWQESAAYSNAILSVSSTGSMTQLTTRGPPVAEAGFSMTALEAAYLNGSNTVASQQNFVLIGGQTDTAFINMSQIALFSLPEESWSFASVDSSAITTSFEPRSGHAATLSNDGKTIFVSGGWVGDINTPAEPQFLALSIGSSYGGSGDWSWNIPTQTGNAPNLYGHSMISSPGDVLMIIGGYSLPPSSSKIRKRDPTSNSAIYFFNTSSSTWINDYTNPDIQSTPDQNSPGNNKVKIGLGVGLGLGLGLLIILALCLWFGRRKIREHRRDRDRRLLQQSLNAANGPQPFAPEQTQWTAERNRTGADPYPWAPVQGDPASVRQTSQAEGTGLAYDIPSPTRGLRRSLHTRTGSYKYEDINRSRAAGHIHTIAESDENEKSQEMTEVDIVGNAPLLDPFQDPPHLLDRRSPSPTSPAHERELEMQHWYSDWAEAERQQQSGRTSPNKSDRTSSSLSDSNRSIVSALSYQPSVRRTGSKKSTPQISPPDSPMATTQRRKRSKSFGMANKQMDSFPKLQAQGQALLGTPPAAGESSLKRTGRSKGLMGSVRRALGGDRELVNAPERSATTAGMSPRPLSSTSPQRSSSVGTSTYIQRRQGAQDWGENPSPPKSVAEDAVEEDDWDVESAVERRVVQVMFTVPRGSLRVVNAGPESDAVSVAEAGTPLLEDPSVERGTEERDKGKKPLRGNDI